MDFNATIRSLLKDELTSALHSALAEIVADALAVRGKEPVVADAVYSLKHAAALANCDYDSVLAATKNSYLKAIESPAGRQVTGRELMRWLASGGQTGRNKGTIRKRSLSAAA